VMREVVVDVLKTVRVKGRGGRLSFSMAKPERPNRLP
jgi:hypothetical protein